jgi:serine/threonine-protein kinase
VEALAGRYAIERELGRGGMATVYLAHDLQHARLVALKVLHPELAATLGPDRFLREIRLSAQLQHPNILPVFDSGEAAGRLWYTMPYVEGQSLRELLRREVQLGVDQTLQIVREVAEALSYAHQHGIIHRDIKPENILLSGGHALIADFGLAKALEAGAADKLTQTGLALGTPAYMSPEQASGDGRLDGRADLYALGCVLYEMLAGCPPFTGPTVQAILARHAVDPVPTLRTVRGGVPEFLELAVARALAKVPADRFATLAEFRRALDESSAPAVRQSYRRRTWGRRQFLVAGAAISLFGLGVVGLLRRARPAPATDRGTLAVLPFRVAGASPELAWLHEGMVDLLTIKLTGEAGPSAVEPRSVLSAWRRAAPSPDDDVTPQMAVEIAERVGAGRVIDGSVVGTPAHVTLTAALLTLPDARGAGFVSVEGSADSLPLLVDQLAAQLLGLRAGVESSRLSSLTSTSVAAVRAYLEGRSAFRMGRMVDAVGRFNEATRTDSTFALAGLWLMRASIWGGGDEDRARGRRIALAGRDRLATADRALLDSWSAPLLDAPAELRRLEAAVAAAPQRSDVWYDLGDHYFHDGTLAGIDHPFRRAAEAFRRGWTLDSAASTDSTRPEQSPILAEPHTHMVEIAQMEGDTASVRRLVAIGLRADSTGERARYLRWHLAIARGDSARQAYWARLKVAPAQDFINIGLFSASTGIAGEDGQRASAEALRLSQSPGLRAAIRHFTALSYGRPAEALQTADLPGDRRVDGSIRRIAEALYWGGDTTAALAAARRLAPFADGSSADVRDAQEQYQAICALAHWRLARRKLENAEVAIHKLRTAIVPGLSGDDSTSFVQYTELCGALLEAMRSAALRSPDARSRLLEADSLARTFISAVCCGEPDKLVGTNFWSGANLVIARLAEAQGDLSLALRAVRRRGAPFNLGPAFYLASYLREEGRLATLTADTAGAIRAYQHYLALRTQPEAAVRPEVERVRAELAQLLAGLAGTRDPP